MNTIIEQALQLCKEEKIELYHALQNNLDFENDGFTDEQWKQLNETTTQADNGTTRKISGDEMIRLVKQRRNSLSPSL